MSYKIDSLWSLVGCALLLTGCASLQQQPELSDKPLVADERFHDLQVLVTGGQPDAQTLQAHFDEALARYRAGGNYACRHPIYAHYFSRRLKQPLDTSQCPPGVPFYLYDRRHGGVVRYIRPDQVVAMHLLFFSNGQHLVSRFGHVGLRLVICPKQAPTDPTLRRQACDQNLFEHITLGYMARVNEADVSFYKGLTGGYRARLMAFPFMDTYFVNTVLENRNIYSLPLKLDAHLLAGVVRELSEIQWSYNGRYRFLTNNCATLLQDALNAVLRKNLGENSLPESTYLRPDHLFAAIKASPIGESASLGSLKRAETAGFYFPSNRPYYQQALDMLNQHSGSINYVSLQDYIATPARRRMQAWLDDPRFSAALVADDRLLEALKLVEEYALLTTDQQITQQMTKLLATEKTQQQLEALRHQIKDPVERNFLSECYLRPLQEMTRDSRRFDGIPDAKLVRRHYANKVDCARQAVKVRVNARIKSQLSIEDGTSEYVGYLNKQLAVINKNLGLLEQLK